MSRDDEGTRYDGPPRRVVSLVPSLTEAIAATAGELLVGATDWCSHPAALDVPRVGGTKYPDLGALLTLRPDLVVANAEENRVEDIAAIRAGGVDVWVTAPATVPAALDSLGRLLRALGRGEPAWLGQARDVWAPPPPDATLTAVVPIWRRPWMVLGRNTFAGDVLARLGVANRFAADPARYPTVALDRLQGADLVVLPDEPYAFTDDDGPEAFPGTPCALVSGRHLTWYGPSLVEARSVLAAQLRRSRRAPGPGTSGSGPPRRSA